MNKLINLKSKPIRVFMFFGLAISLVMVTPKAEATKYKCRQDGACCISDEFWKDILSVGHHLINSAARTPTHNRRVGGVEGSKHTTCEAVDLNARTPASEIARLESKGYCKYFHNNHYHMSICSSRNAARQTRANISKRRASNQRIYSRGGGRFPQSTSNGSDSGAWMSTVFGGTN